MKKRVQGTRKEQKRRRRFKVKPKYTVEVGSVLAGKTLEVQKEVEMSIRQGLRVVVFKPHLDTRTGNPGQLYTRSKHELPFRRSFRAKIIRSIAEVIPYCTKKRAQVVIFDEGQMFAPELANVIAQLLMVLKCRVFFFGLDTTWRGRIYATTAAAMTIPGAKVFRLKAACMHCGGNAFWSQKIKRGKPVSVLDALEKTQQVGGKELYIPLCGACWLKTPGAMRALKIGLVGTIDPDTIFVDRKVRSRFEIGPSWWPTMLLPHNAVTEKMLAIRAGQPVRSRRKKRVAR